MQPFPFSSSNPHLLVVRRCRVSLSLLMSMWFPPPQAGSRNREVHLPPLSTFRWWARRTGSVNRSVLDAASRVFGRDHLAVLDPFAGGGTIPLVAMCGGHRRSCSGRKSLGCCRSSSDADPALSRLPGEGHAALGDMAEPLLRRAYSTQTGDGQNVSDCPYLPRRRWSLRSMWSVAPNSSPHSLLTLVHRKEKGRPEAILCLLRWACFLRASGSFAAVPDVRADDGPQRRPRATPDRYMPELWGGREAF